MERWLAPLLLVALALAACREAPRTAAPAWTVGGTAVSGADLSGGKDSGPVTVRSAGSYRREVEAVESPGRPALQFTLVAAAAPGPDGILNLSAIEVRHKGSAELLQRLDGLDTQTPSTGDAPGLEQLDLDFDGMPDIRVIESLPAGPNVPYRNWRYDRTSGRFVAALELDEITSPVFNAQRREVRSDWRDGATRYGTDTFAWRDGRLVPQARVASEAGGSGKLTQRRYAWSAGGWVLQGHGRAKPP